MLCVATPHAQAPNVEVATIKRNTSVDARQGSRVLPGGRVELTNMTLRTLIRIAYGTTGAQVVGGPGWIATDGYDIVAKVVGDQAAALKSLLVERFHLRVHSEKREAQTFALLLANRNGTLGPALKGSPADCTPGPADRCGIRGGNGNITYTGLTMAQIVTSLAGLAVIRASVSDRTGLTGRYDLHLEFNDDSPNIFTALVEQAGLKLRAEEGTVDVIVVDSVERPVED
jgi:uncharacterized protein (TIGR03435 family)